MNPIYALGAALALAGTDSAMNSAVVGTEPGRHLKFTAPPPINSPLTWTDIAAAELVHVDDAAVTKSRHDISP
jgi:hypothetical protein